MGQVKALIGASVLALLAGCATPRESALPAGARYVAMGSSFAAGAGIGPTKPGTPERCQRTAINYASLLAARMELSLDDQTCGGATSAHITGPWNELPPQADALDPDTRLVTVTIGGNDINYVGNLFAAGCDPATGMVIQGRKVPCFAMRPSGDDAYERLRTGLRAVAAEVRRRAPQATLVFVQYVTLVPDAPCDSAKLSPENAAVARTIGERLAAVTAEVARESGALVLPADQLSRGHTTCDAVPWSIGLPTGYDGKGGAPWHPTAAGHAAIADALGALLKR